MDDDIHAQRRKEIIDENIVFQPVILVLHNQLPNNRLECFCGAKATFINVELDDNGRIDTGMHEMRSEVDK